MTHPLRVKEFAVLGGILGASVAGPIGALVGSGLGLLLDNSDDNY